MKSNVIIPFSCFVNCAFPKPFSYPQRKEKKNSPPFPTKAQMVLVEGLSFLVSKKIGKIKLKHKYFNSMGGVYAPLK